MTPAGTEVANTPPPLNRLELKIIDSLAQLGIDAGRDELPAQGASIRAMLSNGSMLFVFAGRSGTRATDASVLEERRIEGVLVERIRYPSGPIGDRFECAGDEYEVRTEAPPGFASVDAFLARFIRALGCAA